MHGPIWIQWGFRQDGNAEIDVLTILSTLYMLRASCPSELSAMVHFCRRRPLYYDATVEMTVSSGPGWRAQSDVLRPLTTWITGAEFAEWLRGSCACVRGLIISRFHLPSSTVTTARRSSKYRKGSTLFRKHVRCTNNLPAATVSRLG